MDLLMTESGQLPRNVEPSHEPTAGYNWQRIAVAEVDIGLRVR